MKKIPLDILNPNVTIVVTILVYGDPSSEGDPSSAGDPSSEEMS